MSYQRACSMGSENEKVLPVRARQAGRHGWCSVAASGKLKLKVLPVRARQAGRHGWCSMAASGKLKLKVLPLPGSLRTQMRPPCASTSMRVM